MPRAAVGNWIETRHKTGVVSRVPRSSRNAQAYGTDRNTYQKWNTPATTIERIRNSTEENEEGESAKRLACFTAKTSWEIPLG
jgi:hypothetical protein